MNKCWRGSAASGGDNLIVSPLYCGDAATGWTATNTLTSTPLTLPRQQQSRRPRPIPAAVLAEKGAPRNPHGPASAAGNMAAAHVRAGLPNFQILEFSFGETGWRAELIDPPEEVPGGYLTISGHPGLRIELNENTVRKYAAD